MEPERRSVSVSLVRIRNVLGIESLEFRLSPQGVTVLRGPNESGKTSVLSAVKSALEGGCDATILRRGAESGEVVLVLDNGVEIQEMLAADPAGQSSTASTVKRDLKVKHPDVGAVGAAQRFLESLVRRASLNPVDLIEADPKARVDMFLQANPVEATPALRQLVAEVLDAVPTRSRKVDPSNAIKAVDAARQEVYDERRVVNRELDRARKAAEAAREAIPPGGAEEGSLKRAVVEAEEKFSNLAARAAEAERQVDVYRREGEEKARARLAVELTEAEAAVEKEHEIVAGAFRDAIEKSNRRVREAELALAAANAERAALGRDFTEVGNRRRDAVDAVRTKNAVALKGALREIVDQAEKAAAACAADSRVEQTTAKADLEKAREQLAQHQRQAGLRKLASDREAEAGTLGARSELLTSLLDRLDAEKAGLLKSFPIAGVTVTDGEVHLGGIPFPRLSGAQQIELSLSVAELAAGDLKLVVVDGLERLDEDRFKAFQERASKSRCQFLCTRVDVGAFRIDGDEGKKP